MRLTLGLVRADLAETRNAHLAEDELAATQDALKKKSNDFDRLAKTAAQKRWKAGDWFRSLPVLDAFSSPTKIDQVTLSDLPINYNFRWVTRYDRCTTCHQGIANPLFGRDSLVALTRPLSEQDRGRWDEAVRMLRDRARKLGDPKAAEDAPSRCTSAPG